MSNSNTGVMFIDFLSFTFDMDEDSREGMVRFFHSAVTDIGSMYYPTYEMRKYGYRHGFQFCINQTTRETCKVFYDPWRHNCFYIRIVYNPSKVDSDGQRAIEETFEILTWNCQDYALDSIRITRLDITVDIANVLLNQLLVSAPRLQKSCLYNSPTGTTQSLYIGDKNSALHYCIYDKNKNQHLPHGHEEPIITRFEARIKRSMSPIELQTIANPLANLSVVELGLLRNCAQLNDIDNWFLDSCRYRGMQAALRLCRDSRTRTRYRRIIHDAGAAAWWDPTSLWDAFIEDHMRPIMNLFEIPFRPPHYRRRRRTRTR